MKEFTEFSPFHIGGHKFFFSTNTPSDTQLLPPPSEQPQGHNDARDVQAPGVGDADNRTIDSDGSPPAQLLEASHKSRFFQICTDG